MHRSARRTNIPTAELEAFADADEREPKTLLYPRDPSLDPQLAWKGKDEQDRQDLTIPAVPIYIQEKISPQALIEALRAERRRNEPGDQIDLFNDFNGLEFQQLVEFYEHNQQWTNRMILGDSLLVMASLAEKEGLKGKVQMVYCDPPYGIKFGSNWQVSMRKTDVKDGRLEDATRQPEQIRAFRDTWELGIHSYLTYLRDRLTAARELLSDSGSVFVQIGDQNVHLVRSVLDEVFGSQNFVSLITFKKTSGATGEFLPGTVDYLLWYASNADNLKFRPIYRLKTLGGLGAGAYTWIEERGGLRRRMSSTEIAALETVAPAGRVFRLQILTSQSQGREKGEGAASWFPIRIGDKEYRPSLQARWKTNEAGMARLLAANRIQVSGQNPNYVRFHDDFPAFPLTNLWEDTQSGSSMDKVYVVQTNTKIVERCMLMTTDPGDLVLDPTCGSGTTAFVAEQWGRRWITVDTSRVALALARTRMMGARYPYYLLTDSIAGNTKRAQLEGRIPVGARSFAGDVSKGFVCERIPHVTLKSIATNPDIHPGLSATEIDAAVARHAESEILNDRPYVDPKIVRVTGPFTVESLSPHRVLPSAESTEDHGQGNDSGRFIERIVDYLGKAGVQNTVKKERLTFDRLDLWPGGIYVQALGEYRENGKTRTAAICIGPEYGTVSPELVRAAAKEAVKIADLLVICGFAFEPLVEEQAAHLGRLNILKAKMNPDLSMGDELLKKTGAANLFMVFGQPDIAIVDSGDGTVAVEIRGLDVYDPTTGAVRSHSTDDIACWFIDSDYNGESFFVRHAYFLGADNPYEKLQRALQAEVDEAAWSNLRSTRSRPFPKPLTGKIAVKVINHYGDEVVQVYSA